MNYRIVITPVETESGFRDTKTYEVQEEKEVTVVKKHGVFNHKQTRFTENQWFTLQTFDNIGEANKLLKEKLALS